MIKLKWNRIEKIYCKHILSHVTSVDIKNSIWNYKGFIYYEDLSFKHINHCINEKRIIKTEIKFKSVDKIFINITWFPFD